MRKRQKMKLLTINTHSLQEENYEQKLQWFIDGILREKPDLIAMQEVSQSMNGKPIDSAMLAGQYPVPGAVPIRADNHAAQVASRLRRAGLEVSWVWLSVKTGYEKYDEGLAILSLGKKICSVDTFLLSKSSDYCNWRTRGALGVQLEDGGDWYYTVHMGWWDDPVEPFKHQWEVLNARTAPKRAAGAVWLMGDFNVPDCAEGYELIRSSGWYDSCCLAEHRQGRVTVPGVIDGWRDRERDVDGMRLDYIWCSPEQKVKSCRVIFDGKEYPAVSDHFAVLTEKEG